MSVELLKQMAMSARDRAAVANQDETAMWWAAGRIQTLEDDLARANETIIHLMRVCDENRWPYGKEK